MRTTFKYALFCFVMMALLSCNKLEKHFTYDHGAIVRGDTNIKEIALVFTGDEFGDGGEYITETLKKENIKASFFLTGNFYRNKLFEGIIKKLKQNGNYLGSHSDRHLLYCDWTKRDSMLVSKNEFINDLNDSYIELEKFGIIAREAHYFLPPYEWYNDSIASWTNESGLQLVNYSEGTRSNADYTFPEMDSQYLDSKSIYKSIIDYERRCASRLNGFILLIHIGTDPRRTDKFYLYLPQLIRELKDRNYRFVRINELLNSAMVK
jgi:endoglucanase